MRRRGDSSAGQAPPLQGKNIAVGKGRLSALCLCRRSNKALRFGVGNACEAVGEPLQVALKVHCLLLSVFASRGLLAAPDSAVAWVGAPLAGPALA